MAQDFLNTYKYGWKTSYYQNTYDIKTDDVEDNIQQVIAIDKLLTELSGEDDCESCRI